MVVDSSVWLEILRGGPLQGVCERHLQRAEIRIPTLVIFEVYRKLKDKVAEDVALEAVATLSQYEVMGLSREVALLAADLSLAHKLAMADSIVLAHAHHCGDELLTLDNDFAALPGTVVVRSKPQGHRS